MKSVDKNYKRNPGRGRGENLRPKYVSKERKENMYTNKVACPMLVSCNFKM
jgi:hypothetical protein